MWAEMHFGWSGNVGFSVPVIGHTVVGNKAILGTNEAILKNSFGMLRFGQVQFRTWMFVIRSMNCVGTMSLC